MLSCEMLGSNIFLEPRNRWAVPDFRPLGVCRKLDVSRQRKSAPDYLSAEGAAEYSELLRVLRQELLAHYELPKDLPRQILTLMMALNDHESAVLPTSSARSAKTSPKRQRAK
jgi:hypothetical protein